MALSRVGCSPKVSNDMNTSRWRRIVHAYRSRHPREPDLGLGKWTIHRRHRTYRRGPQGGAACGRDVSDRRRAMAGRLPLTAGEVWQGGIKKPQRLGWAVAAVDAYKLSGRDSPLATCTISRGKVPVKVAPAHGGRLRQGARRARYLRPMFDQDPFSWESGIGTILHSGSSLDSPSASPSIPWRRGGRHYLPYSHLLRSGAISSFI